ncbi:hypothetical protein LZC95_19580 [Pendulispora brunnea]|uniref:Uncharacterized protein n=1 Tax=Pendulispora brunnea TaxID=2905690 RepID=A0ABZ2KPT4_9BACT
MKRYRIDDIITNSWAIAAYRAKALGFVPKLAVEIEDAHLLHVEGRTFAYWSDGVVTNARCIRLNGAPPQSLSAAARRWFMLAIQARSARVEGGYELLARVTENGPTAPALVDGPASEIWRHGGKAARAHVQLGDQGDGELYVLVFRDPDPPRAYDVMVCQNERAARDAAERFLAARPTGAGWREGAPRAEVVP